MQFPGIEISEELSRNVNGSEALISPEKSRAGVLIILFREERMIAHIEYDFAKS